MKKILGIITGALWGSLLAFFGVFASVFADGGLTERLITIAVILAIYFVSAGIWAYFGSSWSWHWSLVIGIPGMLILILYSSKEPALLPFFFIYLVLILILSLAGTAVAGQLRYRRLR